MKIFIFVKKKIFFTAASPSAEKVALSKRQ
jgi:hypothetical protein